MKATQCRRLVAVYWGSDVSSLNHKCTEVFSRFEHMISRSQRSYHTIASGPASLNTHSILKRKIVWKFPLSSSNNAFQLLWHYKCVALWETCTNQDVLTFADVSSLSHEYYPKQTKFDIHYITLNKKSRLSYWIRCTADAKYLTYHSYKYTNIFNC